MRNFLSITKALSDENRVRILLMLCSGERCVCQIIDVLGLAPSTVSKHLSILRQANLIDARKKADGCITVFQTKVSLLSFPKPFAGSDGLSKVMSGHWKTPSASKRSQRP